MPTLHIGYVRKSYFLNQLGENNCFHPDCATLRRELIGYQLMARENGVYQQQWVQKLRFCVGWVSLHLTQSTKLLRI